MAVTSSGSDVPMATIVMAITRSETPIICASFVPLSTRRSEPTTRHTAPTTNKMMFFTMVFLPLSTSTVSDVPAAVSSLALRTFSKMNSANRIRTRRLSSMLRLPFRHSTHKSTQLAIIKRPFGANCPRLMTAGRKMTDSAIMRPVFAVTDPMALPMAISVLPSAAAIVETMTSGMVVATETMVAPMMNCGIPEAAAIQLAASTNQSPPLTISTIPSRNKTMVINSSMVDSSLSA